MASPLLTWVVRFYRSKDIQSATMDPLSYPQTWISENLTEMQHMVEGFHRIQILQEQRIMEFGRQLESYRQRQAEFAQFSRLPPELRCRIWELAILPQIFRPFHYPKPPYLQCSSLPPPTISRVCREARYVAYQHGALYRQELLAPIFWTWFSGQRDILDLSPYCMSENGVIPLPMSLLREARAIILDVGLVNGPLITGLNSKSSHLGNIDTIYLTMESSFAVEKRSWHPHAVARLFRDQSFALVDVEDDQELEHLEQTLQMSDGDDLHWCNRDAIAKLQEVIRPPADKMKAWKDAKRLLLEGWILHHVETSLSGRFFNENGVIKEDEVRKAYPQIPTVQLVQIFELTSRLANRRMFEDIRG